MRGDEDHPVLQPSESSSGVGRMELQVDAVTGRKHFFLNGVRLKDGDGIELSVADGSWIAGTFCWSGNTTRWPGMRIALGGAATDGRRVAAVIAVPPEHATIRLASR
jgi:hypothetical protein